MRFDIHTHAFHPKVASKVIQQLHGHYNIHPVGTGTVEDLLTRLHKAGLDHAVVHTAATEPAQVVPANNWSLELDSTYPELIAFGTMHPDYLEIEKELERLEQAGIRGLKFHPDFQNFALNGKRFFQLMECIEDRFILMIHLGDACSADKCNSSPDKLAEVRRNFPKPPIIAAHLGGYRHWELALDTLAGKDVWMDTSSSLPFIAPQTLHQLFATHPRERILFGSDYPLFDPHEEMIRLQNMLHLSDEQLDDFLCAASSLLDL